jgi:hypothetical protein
VGVVGTVVVTVGVVVVVTVAAGTGLFCCGVVVAIGEFKGAPTGISQR